jgi:cell division protein ZapA (FtsZ GTPase activity inhibitor)
MKNTTMKATGKRGQPKKKIAPGQIIIPKIEGNRVALSQAVKDPDLSYAMHLVVRILQPKSLDDAAAALINLLAEVSEENRKTDQNALVCFSYFQAMMLRSDWMELFQKLRAMQQRRQAKRKTGVRK